MSCTHKFFGHPAHLAGELGLLPTWETKTLIIGTFNPESKWHPNNAAQYYYGRTRNYFWKILPNFSGKAAIPHHDVAAQIDFLKANQIGVTDLLIRIKDADINNQEHVARIRTVLDDKIELFNEFEWNTSHIIHYIKSNDIKAVYFTKLGNISLLHAKPNTFEAQVRDIEKACKVLNIPSFRLHTPSGNALGKGKPKNHNLIHRWYKHNGADQFPFLATDFSLENFKINA